MQNDIAVNGVAEREVGTERGRSESVNTCYRFMPISYGTERSPNSDKGGRQKPLVRFLICCLT